MKFCTYNQTLSKVLNHKDNSIYCTDTGTKSKKLEQCIYIKQLFTALKHLEYTKNNVSLCNNTNNVYNSEIHH